MHKLSIQSTLWTQYKIVVGQLGTDWMKIMSYDKNLEESLTAG